MTRAMKLDRASHQRLRLQECSARRPIIGPAETRSNPSGGSITLSGQRLGGSLISPGELTALRAPALIHQAIQLAHDPSGAPVGCAASQGLRLRLRGAVTWPDLVLTWFE